MIEMFLPVVAAVLMRSQQLTVMQPGMLEMQRQLCTGEILYQFSEQVDLNTLSDEDRRYAYDKVRAHCEEFWQ